MIGEIVLITASFITGMAIPKVLGLHVHKYDIVYHQPVTAFPNGIRYGRASSESYEGANYDNKRTFITCKQCNLCKKRFIRVSDGSDRLFKYDTEFILTQIDIEIQKKKDKEEAELLSRMDDRVKTPEQKEAEAKAKAIEDAEREATNPPDEGMTKEEIIAANATAGGKGYIEQTKKGNIVYVAHRSDGGDEVHIVRSKKRKLKG